MLKIKKKEGIKMLDLTTFQNSFKIDIVGGLKMVHEWTEEGKGDYCYRSRVARGATKNTTSSKKRKKFRSTNYS